MIKIEHIKEYRKKILSSNKELTKKEAFKDLLNRLFPDNKEIAKIIDKFTLGAETTVINIPRKDSLHYGSADTLYNRIIIKFENDLKRSEKHAKEQLAGYYLGQYRSSEGLDYILIASDFIRWKIYAPDLSCLEKIDIIQEHELIINEIKSAAFELNDDNSEDFFYWIDRFLFKESRQKATLKTIQESFGEQSTVFIECYNELNKRFNQAKKFGDVQVSFEQWHKFLSIAYGSFESDEGIFIIHSYLSIFSKMLAFAVVSNIEYIDDSEMKRILDGSIFHKFNIANFVENDFFQWIIDERNFNSLKKVFRLLAQEISTFDFTNVDEDILKGVYQELTDIDTRHSLGEYYTPDWLCEMIVNKFALKTTDKILDPACGSGSFIRAAIHRIKELHPEISADLLCQQVYGIDIHPLSVQIAKTTILLALGKDVLKAKKPAHLNVVLANSLLAPEGVKDLFGKDFELYIDKDKYYINTKILENNEMFENAMEICDELSGQTLLQKDPNIEIFAKILKKQSGKNNFTIQDIESFYEIYKGLKKVKKAGRNGIWKFIITNLYKPFFFSGKFDYVVGNPPWLTYSSVKNEEYRNRLDNLAVKYSVKPAKVANYPHLEIASIFLAHCSTYYLKESGKIAFVLPRSFFNADHHDNTRIGKSKGFKPVEIWDLEGVSPLFRIPACVFLSEKASGKIKRSIKAKGTDGLKINGKLPYHNCNNTIAKNVLTETKVKWFYIRQGGASAISTSARNLTKSINPYKAMFKQGATIVPRAFYFVELNQEQPPDFDNRIINVRTENAIKSDGKFPWRGLGFENRIESCFLFRTALSKSILPFALHLPSLVVLPITITSNPDKGKKIAIHKAIDLMNMGYLHASRWFRNAGLIWEIKRTEKNRSIDMVNYLNWRNKLTEQNLNAEYLVLYNSSAKDANAAVLMRKDMDFEFIVESKAYVYYTDNLGESYYLAAILNSSVPNLLMKDFQTRGLFGPRDIHKKILDVYFPVYNENEKLHKKLAELGRNCQESTQKFLRNKPPQKSLTPMTLGKLRLEIREFLTVELSEIDKIVRMILH